MNGNKTNNKEKGILVEEDGAHQGKSKMENQNDSLSLAPVSSTHQTPAYQPHVLSIPMPFIDHYGGTQNKNCKTSIMSETERFFRHPFRRARSQTRVHEGVNCGLPTKFPASFTPRKAEKMSFEEKVKNWLENIPFDLDLPFPFVECYTPTVSSSSSYEASVGEIDFGDTDLVLERQARVITKLSRKLYDKERHLAGRPANDLSSQNDDQELINRSINEDNAPMNSWTDYPIPYGAEHRYNEHVRVPSEGAKGMDLIFGNAFVENSEEKFYPELVKLLKDCH